jgi:phosphohistidine swiveling domain-containing protein
VKRYGDRGLHDLKLETTVVSQCPDMLIGQLRPVIASGRTVAVSMGEESRARREAESQLRAHCGNPLHLAVLRLLFWSLRRNLLIRENARFCRTELIGTSRRMVRALGQHLVETRQLDAVDDVHDLTIEEILGAYEGGRAGVELRELARIRAAARVVTDPNVDPESCRDRILVARETDPGWMFLMLVAKGLVAERGTVLSHMAITGRIFGVPTVVAVHGVVDRIPDGAWIEVDGDRGTVTALDEGGDENAS